MKLLFNLRAYNDVDHITPIIYKFLINNYQCDVVFLSNFNYSNDYRIIYLKKFKNFRIINDLSFKKKFVLNYLKIRNRFFNNNIERRLRKLKFCNYIFNFLQKNFWINKWIINNGYKAVFYEWGRPGRLNQKEAFWLNIPVIILPHGYNVLNNDFKNYYTNYQMEKFKNDPNNNIKFLERNYFANIYIVSNKHHKNLMINWGMKSDLIQYYGSPRFSNEWLKIHDQIISNFKSNKFSKQKIKIVFFMQNIDYRVNEIEVEKLLNLLINLKDIFLIIKPHTRNNILFENQYKFNEKENVEIVSEVNSCSLIEWSDLVINYGSSIGIDAILRDKVLINAKYLHKNSTIFDDSDVCKTFSNSDDIINFILNENFKDFNSSEYRKNKNIFLKKYINAHNGEDSLMYNYKILKNLIHNYEKSN